MVSVDVKHRVYWPVDGQIGKDVVCICCVFISAPAYDEDLAQVWAKANISSTCLLIQRCNDFRWGSLWSILYIYIRQVYSLILFLLCFSIVFQFDYVLAEA